MVQESKTDDSQNLERNRVRKIEGILAIGVGSVFGLILIGLLVYNVVLNFNICLVPGKATVMGKHVVSDDENNDYMLDYEFEAGGHKVRHSGACTKYTWDRFQTGDGVAINYFAPVPEFASKLALEGLEFKQKPATTRDTAP